MRSCSKHFSFIIVREQVSQNTIFVQPEPQKSLILEYGRERSADQCQIVRRVEMWYTSKDIGPFSIVFTL